MANDAFKFVVRGRNAGKDGHGEKAWIEPVDYLLEGRPEGSMGSAFKARPALGEDLAQALQSIASTRKIERVTFRALAGDLTKLFMCFDTLEIQTEFNFRGGACDIPGQPWFFFREWLETHGEEASQARIYGQCKRVVEQAIRHVHGEIPANLMLPPNPFSQRGRIVDWDQSDDLRDEEYKQVGDALIAQLGIVSERLSVGRRLLPPAAADLPADTHISKEAPEEAWSPATDAGRHALVAYPLIWGELVRERSLPKTAVINEVDIKTIDKHPKDVNQSDLDIEPDAPGKPLQLDRIEQRLAILRVSQMVDLPLGKRGADLAGLDQFQIHNQSRVLINRGALHLRKVNQDNQYLVATPLTDDEILRYEVAAGWIAAPRLGMREQLAVLHEALPTRQELMQALALTLTRTGWNTSSVLNMKASEWHRQHPIQGTTGAYVDLISAKPRANGKIQYAQSSTKRPFSAYDIVRRVLTWTEPLRRLLDQQIAHLDAEMKKASGSAKMQMLNARAELKGMRNRIWLTLSDDGRILIPEVRWRDLNDTFKSLGITRTDGRPISFTQQMTRRAWAVFAYEKSGANLLLTKLALGHSDFGSVLRYIASQKELGHQREKWLGLQQSLLSSFATGSSTRPEALQALMKIGGLSAVEAARVVDARSLTAKGMACANPREPDKHVDPKHQPGRLCGTQNCLDGCSKSFATFDTAVHLAREIGTLRKIRESMPLLAWQSSEYPGQLEAAEKLFGSYSRNNQTAAIKEVARRPRVIFGLPSIQARLAATSTGAVP